MCTAGLGSGDSLCLKGREQGSSCLASGLLGGWERVGRGRAVRSGGRTGSDESQGQGQAARSLESGKWQGCLEVISSSLLPLGPAPADGILPAEDPGRGSLSRNENSPAVTCAAPRRSSQISRKLHGQRGMRLRVCRKPVPSLLEGGQWEWPELACAERQEAARVALCGSR